MNIFYNFSKKIIDEIKILHPFFNYIEAENPNLTEFDIFLKSTKKQAYQIIYRKEKSINCDFQNIHKFLEIVIQLQVSLFQNQISEKKYVSEIKNKLQIYDRNLILEKKLIYDNKLDCYNYAYFKLQCQKEIERFKRYFEPFSVLLLDIDNFKDINDQFGHDIGDIALEKFVTAINNNIRTVDMVFRFGGDEFIVLLHKAMMIGSQIVSRRIQNSINKITFQVENKLVINKIKTSIGIVTISEEIENNILDVDAIFKQADEALYQAKNTGKNKIVHIQSC